MELDTRRLIRPHEQDRAWCVIDDEARGMPEASRTEPLVIAVPSDHEDIDSACHGAHHLTLHATAQADPLGVRVAEPFRGRRQQVRRLVSCDVAIRDCGATPGAAASQQPDGRRIRCLSDIRRRDVEQREHRVSGKLRDCSIDTPLPGSLDHPDDDPHRCH